MTLKAVNNMMPYLGCDPEFFFKQKRRVVGAENFLPTEGFTPNTNNGYNGDGTAAANTVSKIIIDGVQAELNPRPNTCRANLANEIGACFRALKAELDKKGTGIEVDFSQSVSISKTELSKLDEKNQKFGCMPSLNSFKDSGAKLTDVDPLTYRNRSAGGHIHIGAPATSVLRKKIDANADQVVQMLDLICGNTCVLVDRDKGNKIRRKLYGRAGEYRLPAHGIEYRTLSNFWLHSYPLMSLAFGLARLAVELSCDGDSYTRYFLSAVDMNDVQKAINNNDFNLAYKNFKAIEPMLCEVTQDNYSAHHPISGNVMPQFHYFVNSVKEQGIEKWFPEDPMKHWMTLPEAHEAGFYAFLNKDVRVEMSKKK